MTLTTDYQAYEAFIREGQYKNIDPDIARNILLFAIAQSNRDSGSNTGPDPPATDTVNNTQFAEIGALDTSRQSAFLANKSDTNNLKVNFVDDVTQVNWIYNLKPLQTLEISQTTHPRIIYSRITILAETGTCEYSYLEG